MNQPQQQPAEDIGTLHDLLALHGVRWVYTPSLNGWAMVARPDQVPEDLLRRAQENLSALEAYVALNAPEEALSKSEQPIEKEIVAALGDDLGEVDQVKLVFDRPIEDEGGGV